MDELLTSISTRGGRPTSGSPSPAWVAALSGGCSETTARGRRAGAARGERAPAVEAAPRADERIDEDIARDVSPSLPLRLLSRRRSPGGAPRPRAAAARSPADDRRRVRDLHDVVPMDGASLIPTIVATLPSSVVKDGLPGILDHPDQSAAVRERDGHPSIPRPARSSRTTRTRSIAASTPSTSRSSFVRSAPLAPKRRYVVALKGVRLAPAEGAPADAAGLAPPPEGFRRLRDGAVAKDPALAATPGPLRSRGVRGARARRHRPQGPAARVGLHDRERGAAAGRHAARARPHARMARGEHAGGHDHAETKPGSDRDLAHGHRHHHALRSSSTSRPAGRLFRGADGRSPRTGRRRSGSRSTCRSRSAIASSPGAPSRMGTDSSAGAPSSRATAQRRLRSGSRQSSSGFDWWGMSKEDVGRGQHDARRRSRPRRRLRRARAPGDGELARRDGGVPRPAREGAGAHAPDRGARRHRRSRRSVERRAARLRPELHRLLRREPGPHPRRDPRGAQPGLLARRAQRRRRRLHAHHAALGELRPLLASSST